MATLNLPAWGYGIRYQYGMFKQVSAHKRARFATQVHACRCTQRST